MPAYELGEILRRTDQREIFGAYGAQLVRDAAGDARVDAGPEVRATVESCAERCRVQIECAACWGGGG